MAMDIRDQAYRYLASRPRTEKEVRKRLSDRGFGAEEIDETIEELKRGRYVDDAAYGCSYLIYAFGKDRSLARAKYEMKERGLSAEDIQQAMFDYEDEFDVDIEAEDEKRALHASEKFVRAKGCGEKQIAALGRRLKGLGYSTGIIFRMMDRFRQSGSGEAGEDMYE